MSDVPTYKMDRRFNANRTKVWRAWSEAELVQKWYGPGVETEIHKFDFTPGGLWLNEMKMGGGSMRERIEFVDIKPQDHISWVQGVADADWNVIDNPMMPNWPKRLMAKWDFEDLGDVTRVSFEWTPHEVNQEQQDMFAQSMSGAAKGWGSGMDAIEVWLSKSA